MYTPGIQVFMILPSLTILTHLQEEVLIKIIPTLLYSICDNTATNRFFHMCFELVPGLKLSLSEPGLRLCVQEFE